jgi:hypothetical protein
LNDAVTQKYLGFGRKFLKLTGSANTILGLTEVVVPGYYVDASSNYDGKNPNILLDGRIDGSAAGIYRTNADAAKPWVKIEMHESWVPKNVLIYGRTDCCPESMNGVIASVEYGNCS